MLHDLKNYGIVERCSIKKTLLIKQSWMKSRDGAMYGNHEWKSNVEGQWGGEMQGRW